MKTIGFFLILLVATSCSSNKFTLEEYANLPVKFGKQKISAPDNDFILYIPSYWGWKVEENSHENILLNITADSEPDKDGFIDLLSIQKAKSFGGKKDLKSEYKYLLNASKKSNMDIVESGETKLLKYKAYFIHSRSNTNTYGELEMISFIIEGETEGTFYYLNAGASQTNDLKKNMATIIVSLRTFEIKTE